MKCSMQKHDIPLVAVIARQAERICWQKDWMLLSSVNCFRMTIRRIQTGFVEGRLDVPNWLQCLWNFSILIFVDGANLRAVIAGEQSGWFHSTDSCLASLQRALQKHISRICLFVPSECHLEVWRVTYGKKSNNSESRRKKNGPWPRKLGHDLEF